MNKLLTIITTILIITVFAVSPTMAQTPSISAVIGQLAGTNVVVGEETIDGHRQVYYELNGTREFITEGAFNSHHPVINEEYIVYVKDIRGQGQIFLHHIPSQETVQLTHTGTNLNPQVSEDGKVVWERWVDKTEARLAQITPTTTPSPTPTETPLETPTSTPSAVTATPTLLPTPTLPLSPTPTEAEQTPTLEEGWQVVVFDGITSKQITQAGTANNPDIEGDVVVFAESEYGDNWTAKAYSIRENKTEDISTGKEAMYPKIEQGKILLGHQKNQQEFPLTAEDLLLLDLSSLSGEVPQTVSTEDILEELQSL